MTGRDSDDFIPMLFRGLAALFFFVCFIIVVCVVLFFLVPGVLLAAWGVGWHVIGGIIALIFIIWVFSWFFRAVFRLPHGHHHHHDWGFDERNIARRRYARGEITRKEYLAIIKDLDDTK
jgi:uncharacterized membrane protein